MPSARTILRTIRSGPMLIASIFAPFGNASGGAVKAGTGECCDRRTARVATSAPTPATSITPITATRSFKPRIGGSGTAR